MQELENLQQLTKQGEADLQKAAKPRFPGFTWINDFISIAGSVMYERESNREPNDLDIVVRAEEEGDGFKVILDAALRLKIDRIMKARFDVDITQWIGSSHGPNWKYRPIYRLALVPYKDEKTVEMDEPEFAAEFYKYMHWPHYCDYGCDYFSEFTGKNPEFDTLEFRSYVACKNMADRDDGELQDIAKFEILRLAEIYAEKNRISFRKAELDICMIDNCDKPPEYEALWADRRGHCWFCEKHMMDFIEKKVKEKWDAGAKTTGIVWVKAVEGRASRNVVENTTPDVQEFLTEEIEAMGRFKKEIRIFEKKEDEHIVSGVVYEPDTEDVQHDEASADEIRKAAYSFMEGNQRFKAYHKGKEIKTSVLESYLAPVDFLGENRDLVKKGSWVLTARVLDIDIWAQIKSGEITGWSMAGHSTVPR